MQAVEALSNNLIWYNSKQKWYVIIVEHLDANILYQGKTVEENMKKNA